MPLFSTMDNTATFHTLSTPVLILICFILGSDILNNLSVSVKTWFIICQDRFAHGTNELRKLFKQRTANKIFDKKNNLDTYFWLGLFFY